LRGGPLQLRQKSSGSSFGGAPLRTMLLFAPQFAQRKFGLPKNIGKANSEAGN